MSRGGKMGNRRLKFYTFKVTMCKVCDRPIPENKENQHFMRSHPAIYYSEYPGRRKMQTMKEGSL